MGNTLMVSVDMITYNHASYIAQAIEGVLMQETTFDYELIIADDCSPDNSEEIIRNIIATHPKGHLIKYHRHEKNIGMNANGIFAINQCYGKYIAICEGDDYWTDPLKLQKQVDFLESNAEYVACQHDRNLLYNDGSLIYEKSDLYIFTQCFVFKNVLDDTFYQYVKNVLNADTFLEYYLKLFGKIKHLDFVGAVYRITGSGIYTSMNDETKKKNALFTYKQILKIQKDHSATSSLEFKNVQGKITEYQFSILISNTFKIKEFLRYVYYLINYRRIGYLIEYKRLYTLFFRNKSEI